MTEKPADPQPQTAIEAAQPYQLMDKRDEGQIVAEMTGETTLIEEYVYSFKQGSRQVTSLSYSGIKEMVRRRGNFEIVSTEKEETDKTIRIIVKIRDLVNRVDFLGASETEKDKPFAYVLAVNKAERNAYRKAMPAELIAKMVDAFLHGAKTETLASPPAKAPDTFAKQEQSIKQVQAANPQEIFKKPDSPMAVEAAFPPELQELLEFRFADTKMLVKPIKFLGNENFAAVSTIVRQLGGEYISAGRDSHFEVPLGA